jgi:hypothetical protein
LILSCGGRRPRTLTEDLTLDFAKVDIHVKK